MRTLCCEIFLFAGKAKSMKSVRVIAFISACVVSGSAWGAPILVQTIDVSAQFSGGAFGIDFNRSFGETYLISANTIQRYDLSFNHLGSITLSGGGLSNSTRQGIHRDAASGDFFVTNHLGVIHRFDSTGNFVSSFAHGGAGNGMAYDPNTNTIWVASFNGGVEQFSLAGASISSFSPSTTSSPVGIAYDAVSDTLLVGENGSDAVEEYTTSGTALGTFLPSPVFVGNGLGMDYDEVTGNFYYGGQTFPGSIEVYKIGRAHV